MIMATTLQKIIGLLFLCCICISANAETGFNEMLVKKTEHLQNSLSASANITPVKCYQGNDGSASVEVSGGTAPYTYSWAHDGSTDPVAGSLTAGTYHCTVTDNNGSSTVVEAIVTEPTALLAPGNIENTSCFNSYDGKITLNVSGGTAPYSYIWTETNETTSEVANLQAGIYSCTVSDANGCSIYVENEVGQPDQIIVDIEVIDVTCVGMQNGKITVTVTGGVPNYTFDWQGLGVTGNVADNLSGGEYFCMITDATGCSLSEPRLIEVSEPETELVTIALSNDVSCNGNNDGSAYIMSLSGTAEYFEWSNGATTSFIDQLSPGTYYCIFSDQYGCEKTDSVIIAEPALLEGSYTSTATTCTGSSDGSAEVTAIGGNGSYSYLWNDGTTGNTLSNVVAGSYVCTISDLRNCSADVNVLISSPMTDALTATANIIDISCAGSSNGSIEIIADGGTPAYTYLWSDGLGTSNEIINLEEGDYVCTIEDAIGCQTTIEVSLNAPSPMIVKTWSTPGDCDETNSAKVTVTGGTPAYNYMWSNGAIANQISDVDAGTYVCTVTDANGCSVEKTFTIDAYKPLMAYPITSEIRCDQMENGHIHIVVKGGTPDYTYMWNNGYGTESELYGLGEGDYNCVITDADGCETSIEVSLNAPSPIVAKIWSAPVQCGQNGSAKITLTGGVSDYSYEWSNGATTNEVYNLAPGTYYCTAWDGNGCTVEETFEIEGYAALDVTAQVQNVSSNGNNDGSIQLVVTGGSSNYTFEWNNNLGTTSQLTGLAAGVYTCNVTDENGCTTSIDVNVTEPAPMDVTSTKVADEARQNEAVLYPNPASSSFAIQAPFEITEINISNTDGKVVFTGNETEVEVNTLADGIYFVKAQTKYGMITKKLVVRKN